MQEEKTKFTILIVDDTYTNVLILKKTLLNAGYDVVFAENGPDGRKLAEEKRPDLILLDIMMPGEDGFETIKQLKMNPSIASIPVIFLTALSDVESKVKGFELGAVDYITKPFHPAEIRARTRLHIKLSIATNALIESQTEKLRQIETAQQAMLVQPEEMPEAKFDVIYNSLQEAGGDFYDVLSISDNTHAYFVADVSGHDIATSFITASVKALLKQNSSPIYSPTETMQMINRVLIDVLPQDKYLTACYLTVNRKTSKGCIVNMGHPPVIYQPVGGEAQLIVTNSDVLGAFKDVMFSEYDFSFSAGDRIFLYSDGLVESSEDSSLWSGNLEKLIECVSGIGGTDMKQTLFEINRTFYPELRKPGDDVVIMGVEI